MAGKGGIRSTSWKSGTQPVKQKGTKHKKTLLKESVGLKNWEGLKQYIETEGAERLVSELKNLKGRDYVIAFQSMTEFVKPKLARQEVKAEIDATISSKKPVIHLPDGTMLEI